MNVARKTQRKGQAVCWILKLYDISQEKPGKI